MQNFTTQYTSVSLKGAACRQHTKLTNQHDSETSLDKQAALQLGSVTFLYCKSLLDITESEQKVCGATRKCTSIVHILH